MPPFLKGLAHDQINSFCVDKQEERRKHEVKTATSAVAGSAKDDRKRKHSSKRSARDEKSVTASLEVHRQQVTK
jgi:hypothetical protein